MLYFKDNLVSLYHSDTFKMLEKLPARYVDLVVADPPYFLSNGGISNRGGEVVSVDKGSWDKVNGFTPEDFYSRFLKEIDRVMAQNATMWIFGSMHNIYILGYLLPKFGFKILNNVTWQKENPSPNLSHRMFTHSTETILWVKRNHDKQIFNYELMQQLCKGKQMTDVWTTPTITNSERRFGKHPTQKPLAVIDRILLSSTSSTSRILDPFVGSGTTVVAARRLGLKSCGIDNCINYLDIAQKRVSDYGGEKIGKIW
jgi:site-specific DNA-methyltransferase (adenine-specific)